MAETGWTNANQPMPLVRAQYALYLWGPFLVVRDLMAGGMNSGLLVLTVVTGFLAIVCAYGIAGERKWAYWLAVVLCMSAIVPLADEITRRPVAALRPDFWLVVFFPIFIATQLLAATSRDYQRAWYR